MYNGLSHEKEQSSDTCYNIWTSKICEVKTGTQGHVLHDHIYVTHPARLHPQREKAERVARACGREEGGGAA